MQAIILAGGLGTRLRGVIGEVPKCMAPVNGRPFLHYLLKYLEGQGVMSLMLSLGYKSEAVIGWLRSEPSRLHIDWVIEPEPLGTGGGIRLALAACTEQDVFVLNGDTMFTISLADLHDAHQMSGAETTLALKAMRNFDRYGTVNTAAGGCIVSFEEKAHKAEGIINGGIYIICRDAFLSRSMPQRFSFEKDYLERHAEDKQFFGYTAQAAMDAYFIDIGVPDDYTRAQQDFKNLFPDT